MDIIVFGIGPLLLGFLLDLLLGDPRWLPHPVRAMGAFIRALEKRLRRGGPHTPAALRAAGYRLVFFCAAAAFAAYAAALALAAAMGGAFRFAVEAFLVYQLLAARDLRAHAYRVYKKLRTGDIAGARAALSLIVGRDTAALEEPDILRAAVETVAENTADGIVAPLFYLALGGPALGAVYKMINTLDSMVGYKNARYIDFGRGAAKLDDAACLLPSRMAALAMIGAAGVCNLDMGGALRVWRRDRRAHPSPNSGQTEAACAGALGIGLGGASTYGGVNIAKPAIGDSLRPPARTDILAANNLSLATGMIALAVCAALRLLLLLFL